MKGVSIPRSKWDVMSKADQDLLRKVGILPDKPTVPKGARVAKSIKQNPYILGVVMTCKLCDSVDIELYRMVEAKTEEGYYLEARKPLEPFMIPNKWSFHKLNTCKQCKNFLRKQKRDTLITLVLKYASRRYFDTGAGEALKPKHLTLEEITDVRDE